jgi:hypothetical protein
MIGVPLIAKRNVDRRPKRMQKKSPKPEGLGDLGDYCKLLNLTGLFTDLTTTKSSS